MIISLPISFNIYIYIFWVPKRTVSVLLSTHNICFGLEIRKLNFWYVILTKGPLPLFYLKSIQDNYMMLNFIR